MAYVKAIRCAQHFIYIENQYFLGSSYNWPDYKTAGSCNPDATILFQRFDLRQSPEIVYLTWSFLLVVFIYMSLLTNLSSFLVVCVGANHIIPMELALKICSKIKEGKRFCAYIVIPMWPEGIPTEKAVQEILYFQVRSLLFCAEFEFKTVSTRAHYAPSNSWLDIIGDSVGAGVALALEWNLGRNGTKVSGSFVIKQSCDIHISIFDAL